MKESLIITGIIAALLSVAAYFTHLYWTVTMLFGAGDMQIKQAVLAIVGAIFPPIGVIHGFVIWF